MKSVYIGFVATIISAASLLPTLHTVVNKKSTRSINYLYLALGIVAQLLWFLYAMLNRDWPVLFLSIYLLSVYLVIGYTKYKYEKNGEDEYSILLATNE